MDDPKKATPNPGGHLAAAEAAEERRLGRLLAEAGRRPEPPEEDLAAIKAAFRAEWKARLERRRPRWGLLVPLAASVVIVAGAAWWWSSRTHVPERIGIARVERATGAVVVHAPQPGVQAAATTLEAGQEILAGAELQTAGRDAASPGRAALRLASGHSLRLDSGSRVRLVTDAVAELERGALYVDGGRKPAAGGGIEIHTRVGVAREVGTQFEVRLLDGESPRMRVRVREGSVVVEGGEGTQDAHAGMELTLRAGGAVERAEIAPYGPAWSWVLDAAPRFEIEGRSLREFLGWVARETGWRIRFDDPELEAAAGTVVLHGRLGDLDPDETPAVVLPGAGLRSEVAAGELVVTAADEAAERGSAAPLETPTKTPIKTPTSPPPKGRSRPRSPRR